MRLFVYVLAVDGGFAPNPFHGWCTLACCKPAIRRRARPGDWVVGLTPRALGNRVAYAMKVDESLSFAEYWADPRFRAKRPRRSGAGRILERRGDNCYQPVGDGRYRQVPGSTHWDKEANREDQRTKATDLGGKRVLVGRRFCYFGVDAVPIPGHISFRLPARFHRTNFTEAEKRALVAYLEQLPQGIRGRPRNWPADERSWRQRQPRCA